MYNHLFSAVLALRRRPFFRVIRRTLISLFPIALLGSFAQMINNAFISDSGLIFDISYGYQWMSDHVWDELQQAFSSLQFLTFGLIGLFACYLCARYYAFLKNRDGDLAGITAALVVLIISTRYQKGDYDFQYAMFSNKLLLLNILLGLFIGWIFTKVNPPIKNSSVVHTVTLQTRVLQGFKTLVPFVIVAMMIDAAFNILSYHNYVSGINNWVTSLGTGDYNLFIKGLIAILTTSLEWLGMVGPYNIYNAANTGAASANYTYVLTHHSLNVPYPFLGSTIYNSFGTFGGSGLTLALLIAILMVAKTNNLHRLARWNIAPVFFNTNYGLLLGTPVILNPAYLLPFVFLPILNIAIAGLAILIHIVPTPAYPVPSGTPGPLYAFLGTNGNWASLILSLLLLALDVWCYIPFVKFAEKIERTVEKLDQEED